MNDFLWLIPGAPLLGALYVVIFGRKIPYVATVMVMVSAILVIFLWCSHEILFSQKLYTWMSVQNWQPSIAFRVDRVTLIMLGVATWVGFLIHLFSIDFMAKESSQRRYYFYLNLFIVGMVIFVMADNLVLLYMGWEIMGLCSYALVSFYFQNQHYAYCGRKAFVVTRIGDMALAIAILLIFTNLGTVDINDIFQHLQTQNINEKVIFWIAILLWIAGVIKSAQFPLHIWLPDAMSGPATVSALIHAATMVTAGVYLLIRFYPIFDSLPDLKIVIAFFGCITAFFAATVALAQNRIKRVLAYSTISQIGYMFAAAGIGAGVPALFHLMVHACFKALLFMCSGLVMKSFAGEEDMRRMGGLIFQQKFLSVFYLIGSVALAAIPVITAGFFSKEAIITELFISSYGKLLAFLALAGALLTGMYTMRMYIMVFCGQARSLIVAYSWTWRMYVPLTVLAIASLTLGWIQVPPDWSVGWQFLSVWLSPVLNYVSPQANSAILTFAGYSVAILGILFAVFTNRVLQKPEINTSFLYEGWYINQLWYKSLVSLYVVSCKLMFMIEKILNNTIDSLVKIFLLFHHGLKKSHSGLLHRYIYWMLFGVIILLAYLLVIR